MKLKCLELKIILRVCFFFDLILQEENDNVISLVMYPMAFNNFKSLFIIIVNDVFVDELNLLTYSCIFIVW